MKMKIVDMTQMVMALGIQGLACYREWEKQAIACGFHESGGNWFDSSSGVYVASDPEGVCNVKSCVPDIIRPVGFYLMLGCQNRLRHEFPDQNFATVLDHQFLVTYPDDEAKFKELEIEVV